MEFLLRMRIGGISLGMWCAERVEIDRPEPGYELFVDQPGDYAHAFDLNVTLELDKLPSCFGFRKIFDCGESWEMFARGDERLVIHKPREKLPSMWAFRLRIGDPGVTVYCAEALVRRKGGRAALRNPLTYPVDLIMLMYAFACRNGVIVHCSGANISGNGLLFPGCSGAGKSTFSNLIVSRPDVRILSDDRIIAVKMANFLEAFGTPWLGTAARCRNDSAPLKGIAFLGRGQVNSFKRIPTSAALEKLLPLVSVPWFDKAVMPGVLQFCGEMVSATPCYELLFKPDNSVLGTLDAMLADCVSHR